MKAFFKYLFAAACLCGFAACDDKDDDVPAIWDFSSYSVYFAVEDAETGANLLDPSVEGNLLDRVKVIYKGKEYPRFENEGLDLSEDEVRALPTCPFGLRWGQYRGYCISFGEFAPTANYQGEPFTVDWGDGSKTEVVLNCYITWDDDDPTVHRYLVVDGAPAEDQLGWYVRLKR